MTDSSQMKEQLGQALIRIPDNQNVSNRARHDVADAIFQHVDFIEACIEGNDLHSIPYFELVSGSQLDNGEVIMPVESIGSHPTYRIAADSQNISQQLDNMMELVIREWGDRIEPPVYEQGDTAGLRQLEHYGDGMEKKAARREPLELKILANNNTNGYLGAAKQLKSSAEGSSNKKLWHLYQQRLFSSETVANTPTSDWLRQLRVLSGKGIREATKDLGHETMTAANTYLRFELEGSMPQSIAAKVLVDNIFDLPVDSTTGMVQEEYSRVFLDKLNHPECTMEQLADSIKRVSAMDPNLFPSQTLEDFDELYNGVNELTSDDAVKQVDSTKPKSKKRNDFKHLAAARKLKNAPEGSPEKQQWREYQEDLFTPANLAAMTTSDWLTELRVLSGKGYRKVGEELGYNHSDTYRMHEKKGKISQAVVAKMLVDNVFDLPVDPATGLVAAQYQDKLMEKLLGPKQEKVEEVEPPKPIVDEKPEQVVEEPETNAYALEDAALDMAVLKKAPEGSPEKAEWHAKQEQLFSSKALAEMSTSDWLQQVRVLSGKHGVDVVKDIGLADVSTTYYAAYENGYPLPLHVGIQMMADNVFDLPTNPETGVVQEKYRDAFLNKLCDPMQTTEASIDDFISKVEIRTKRPPEPPQKSAQEILDKMFMDVSSVDESGAGEYNYQNYLKAAKQLKKAPEGSEERKQWKAYQERLFDDKALKEIPTSEWLKQLRVLSVKSYRKVADELGYPKNAVYYAHENKGEIPRAVVAKMLMDNVFDLPVDPQTGLVEKKYADIFLEKLLGPEQEIDEAPEQLNSEQHLYQECLFDLEIVEEISTSDWLRQLRVLSGQTTDEIAKRLGLQNAAAYLEYENSESLPVSIVVKMLADNMLNLPTDPETGLVSEEYSNVLLYKLCSSRGSSEEAIDGTDDHAAGKILESFDELCEVVNPGKPEKKQYHSTGQHLEAARQLKNAPEGSEQNELWHSYQRGLFTAATLSTMSTSDWLKQLRVLNGKDYRTVGEELRYNNSETYYAQEKKGKISQAVVAKMLADNVFDLPTDATTGMVQEQYANIMLEKLCYPECAAELLDTDEHDKSVNVKWVKYGSPSNITAMDYDRLLNIDSYVPDQPTARSNGNLHLTAARKLKRAPENSLENELWHSYQERLFDAEIAASVPASDWVRQLRVLSGKSVRQVANELGDDDPVGVKYSLCEHQGRISQSTAQQILEDNIFDLPVDPETGQVQEKYSTLLLEKLRESEKLAQSTQDNSKSSSPKRSNKKKTKRDAPGNTISDIYRAKRLKNAPQDSPDNELWHFYQERLFKDETMKAMPTSDWLRQLRVLSGQSADEVRKNIGVGSYSSYENGKDLPVYVATKILVDNVFDLPVDPETGLVQEKYSNAFLKKFGHPERAPELLVDDVAAVKETVDTINRGIKATVVERARIVAHGGKPNDLTGEKYLRRNLDNQLIDGINRRRNVPDSSHHYTSIRDLGGAKDADTPYASIFTQSVHIERLSEDNKQRAQRVAASLALEAAEHVETLSQFLRRYNKLYPKREQEIAKDLGESSEAVQKLLRGKHTLSQRYQNVPTGGDRVKQQVQHIIDTNAFDLPVDSTGKVHPAIQEAMWTLYERETYTSPYVDCSRAAKQLDIKASNVTSEGQWQKRVTTDNYEKWGEYWEQINEQEKRHGSFEVDGKAIRTWRDPYGHMLVHQDDAALLAEEVQFDQRDPIKEKPRRFQDGVSEKPVYVTR